MWFLFVNKSKKRRAFNLINNMSAKRKATAIIQHHKVRRWLFSLSSARTKPTRFSTRVQKKNAHIARKHETNEPGLFVCRTWRCIFICSRCFCRLIKFNYTLSLILRQFMAIISRALFMWCNCLIFIGASKCTPIRTYSPMYRWHSRSIRQVMHKIFTQISCDLFVTLLI